MVNTLFCCKQHTDIKIQDADAAPADERWFVYGAEKKHEIVNFISSSMLAFPSISTTTNMEPKFSSPQLNGNEVDVSGQKVRHSNSHEIQVVGNRIFDSANGKTCHQCRQKTRDFAASCKNPRNGKPCVIKLCHKCLLNRYGEKAEEVEMSNDWICPKCRGICNCSCCMKKRGQLPTGALSHTAKALGFKSVSEMLSVKGSGDLESDKVNDAAVFPKNEATLEKEQKCDDNLSSEMVLTGKSVSPIKPTASEKCAVPEKQTVVDRNQETLYGVKDGPEAWASNDFFFDPMTLASNGFSSISNPCGNEEMHKKPCNDTVALGDGDNGGVNSQMGIAQSLKAGKCPVNLLIEKTEEEIPLPPGTAIKEILDIEFSQEDVGNALQFLEFCRVFGKALDVKNGEAKAILRDLLHEQNLRCGQNTLAVQFQIRLLTLILSDLGIESPSLTTTDANDSWLKALETLISKSNIVLKEFPLDWLKKGTSGYYDLDLSKKLCLLNFICDEALATKELRIYIDDQNARFAEEKKEAKSKVAEAKEKERSLKQKLQDEMAKVVTSNSNEASLSISEHNALLLKIKSEAARAHTDMLEAKGTIPKRKQSSDAMRADPEFLDTSGQRFWKLKSYNGEYAVLLQDIKMQDANAAAANERWFVYGHEQKHEIDKYIFSRAKRYKIRKVCSTLSNEINEENMSVVSSS